MAQRASVPFDLACCKPNNLPLFPSSTHTHTNTHTYKTTCSPPCPATPDDWLFVCVEEFTLRCVQGNWLPVVLPGPSSPSLASLQRFVWYWRQQWWRLWEGVEGYIYSPFVLSSGGAIHDYLDAGESSKAKHTLSEVASQYMALTAAIGSQLLHIMGDVSSDPDCLCQLQEITRK